MSNTLKLVIYVLLAGLVPALMALAHASPQWAWLSTLAPMIAALGAGLHVDGVAATTQITALRSRLARLTTSGPLAILIAFAAGTATLACNGCAGLTPSQGAAVETAGVDLAVCVLNHINEPIQRIVTDCGAATAADVIKVLDAHRAATIRERADGGS